VDKCGRLVGDSGIVLSESGIMWESLQNMLIGEYEHTLDEKKRISLPKAFRKELGKKMVITRGLDNCLFLYPETAWTKIAGKLQELSFAQADTRGFNRFMLSGAVEVSADKAGRILIPDHQKQFAGLGKTVVFAGVSDRVEIWDKSSWSAYKQRIEKQADAMAEKLGEIGIL
jgi:MraZ protein